MGKSFEEKVRADYRELQVAGWIWSMVHGVLFMWAYPIIWLMVPCFLAMVLCIAVAIDAGVKKNGV